MTKKSKLFIDASVLFAAIFSKTGASGFILRLAKKGIFNLIMTERVLKEVKRNLLADYDREKLIRMIELLSDLKESIKPNTTESQEKKFQDLIEDKNDLHILAGAKLYRADFLITLDKKHFMTEKLKNANLPFKIISPGKYLKHLRKMPKQNGL